VTNGTYSWELQAGQNPNYAFALGGTASTAITALLAIPGQTISIDVYAPGGSFGYQQWDLTSNNNGPSGAYSGYQSLDSYSFPESPVIGSETTLTWTVPSAASTYFAANPTSTTSLNFQIGGSLGAGTPVMYIDNLRASIAVPEPATLVLLGLGGLGLAGMAIRRRR
jgi:hypothetical protein